jgi:hypothetical protein
VEAYQGYTENGRIIPLFEQAIPNGRRAIITVLDEVPAAQNTSRRQKNALAALEEALANCREPLPPEFDDIIAQRANIARNIEL